MVVGDSFPLVGGFIFHLAGVAHDEGGIGIGGEVETWRGSAGDAGAVEVIFCLGVAVGVELETGAGGGSGFIDGAVFGVGTFGGPVEAAGGFADVILGLGEVAGVDVAELGDDAVCGAGDGVEAMAEEVGRDELAGAEEGAPVDDEEAAIGMDGGDGPVGEGFAGVGSEDEELWPEGEGAAPVVGGDAGADGFFFDVMGEVGPAVG